MLTAQVVDLTYKPGSYECVQSYSSTPWTWKNTYMSHYAMGANRVEDRNTGWADVFYPSRLTLSVNINGENKEIWLERLFRSAIGRLTQKRRKVIQKFMPQEVAVVEKTGRKGTKYFVLSDDELQTWISRVQATLPARRTCVRA